MRENWDEKLRWFVGTASPDAGFPTKRVVFKSRLPPKPHNYPKISYCFGPLRTRRAALWAAVVGPHPVYQTPGECEKYGEDVTKWPGFDWKQYLYKEGE
jgi:hypothetical protein